MLPPYSENGLRPGTGEHVCVFEWAEKGRGMVSCAEGDVGWRGSERAKEGVGGVG